MRKSQSLWPGGPHCGGGSGLRAVPPCAPHPPLLGSFPRSCDSDSAMQAPAKTCFFGEFLHIPSLRRFSPRQGCAACVARPPPPLVRGVNQGWGRRGTAGGRPARQRDSGGPISEAEWGPRLPPPPSCTFLGGVRSSGKLIASEHPGAGSSGCGGPGWTRTPDFAPAPLPALARQAAWQEPCTAFGSAGLMLIPWLWPFPLVFMRRIITLGGGCRRRSFALPEGRVVGHRLAITAGRTSPSLGPRP